MSEEPFTTMTALVPTLAEALAAELERPFAIFGHSMGALIGFELARQLRRQFGAAPVRLFASGFRAPHIPLAEPLLHRLPADDFSRRIRELQDAPKEAVWNDEYMRLMLPTLRADLALCETYDYCAEERLGCAISALGGLHDQRVKEADLVAWAEHTSVAFTLRMFQGSHLFLNDCEIDVTRSIVDDLSCQLASSGV